MPPGSFREPLHLVIMDWIIPSCSFMFIYLLYSYCIFFQLWFIVALNGIYNEKISKASLTVMIYCKDISLLNVISWVSLMKPTVSGFLDHAFSNSPVLRSSRYNQQPFLGYISSVIGKKHLWIACMIVIVTKQQRFCQFQLFEETDTPLDNVVGSKMLRSGSVKEKNISLYQLYKTQSSPQCLHDIEKVQRLQHWK